MRAAPQPPSDGDDDLIARVRRLEVTLAREIGLEGQTPSDAADRPRLLALLDDLQTTRASLEIEAGRLRAELDRLDRGMSAAGAYGRAGRQAPRRQG